MTAPVEHPEWKVPDFEVDGNLGYLIEDVDGWAQEACNEINRLQREIAALRSRIDGSA